jgi:hypothetical protein
LRSQKPAETDRALISDPDARAMVGDISVMTRRRWQVDPKIGWPKVRAIIRGRRYLLLRDVHDLIDKLTQATASGESATVAPVPHRRSAKAIGGAVDG